MQTEKIEPVVNVNAKRGPLILEFNAHQGSERTHVDIKKIFADASSLTKYIHILIDEHIDNKMVMRFTIKNDEVFPDTGVKP
jgi:hypothetical protein